MGQQGKASGALCRNVFSVGLKDRSNGPNGGCGTTQHGRWCVHSHRLKEALQLRRADNTANYKRKETRSKEQDMAPRKLFALGGIIASVTLVAFGIAPIVIGYQGREEVRDTLRREDIIGPEDSRIPGQLVDTGAKAKAQADIIREHQLARTGGLTYAEMGRYATPDGKPKGTNDVNPP